MDKGNGGGEVGQGRVMGENGDNCNWTTIKKEKANPKGYRLYESLYITLLKWLDTENRLVVDRGWGRCGRGGKFGYLWW